MSHHQHHSSFSSHLGGTIEVQRTHGRGRGGGRVIYTTTTPPPINATQHPPTEASNVTSSSASLAVVGLAAAAGVYQYRRRTDSRAAFSRVETSAPTTNGREPSVQSTAQQTIVDHRRRPSLSSNPTSGGCYIEELPQSPAQKASFRAITPDDEILHASAGSVAAASDAAVCYPNQRQQDMALYQRQYSSMRTTTSADVVVIPNHDGGADILNMADSMQLHAELSGKPIDRHTAMQAALHLSQKQHEQEQQAREHALVREQREFVMRQHEKQHTCQMQVAEKYTSVAQEQQELNREQKDRHHSERMASSREQHDWDQQFKAALYEVFRDVLSSGCYSYGAMIAALLVRQLRYLNNQATLQSAAWSIGEELSDLGWNFVSRGCESKEHPTMTAQDSSSWVSWTPPHFGDIVEAIVEYVRPSAEYGSCVLARMVAFAALTIGLACCGLLPRGPTRLAFSLVVLAGFADELSRTGQFMAQVKNFSMNMVIWHLLFAAVVRWHYSYLRSGLKKQKGGASPSNLQLQNAKDELGWTVSWLMWLCPIAVFFMFLFQESYYF